MGYFVLTQHCYSYVIKISCGNGSGMGLKKYKYYFRKPRSELAKDILRTLFLTGALVVASTSPYFIVNLWKAFGMWRKYSKKKFYNAFYALKKSGHIEFKKINRQVYISLTKEGKKKAGRFQIDDLEIERPRRWDGKWRLVIFDIAELKKSYREAFRGKLKQLGFQPLQKSVWVHPFDCRAEVELLREFFGLNDKELRLVIAQDIGKVKNLKKVFEL